MAPSPIASTSPTSKCPDRRTACPILLYRDRETGIVQSAGFPSTMWYSAAQFRLITIVAEPKL